MAKTVMILGSSGDGKTTSIAINPDGKYYLDPKYQDEKIEYNGMNPEETVIFNCDGKDLTFPSEQLGWKEGINLFTGTYDRPLSSDLIEKYLDKINSGSKIKSVIIDTINGSMNDKEMLDSRKMTFDKWYDFAKDYYALISKINSMKNNLVVYIFGHTITDDSGEKRLVTNGRKLEKINLESKSSIVLHTYVENEIEGNNKFYFQTQRNNNSCKTPIGMFNEFMIPNSLKYVDTQIRKFYLI